MTGRSRSPRVESLLFWLLAALVAWVPLPLGSNRPWAWSILELVAFVLLASWLLAWTFGFARMPATLRRAWPALAALGAWLVLQALHLVPLPVAWVELLSPQAARIHRLTEAAGIARSWMTLSVDVHATQTAVMKGLAYAAVFVLVLALVNTRARMLALARVLVYAAVAYAIYGVLMHLAGERQVFFGATIRHDLQASGPFVNRNHFAGFLEMMLAVGVGLLIAGLSDRSADSWKRLARNVLEWIVSPKMVLRLSLCVLVIALTTTHSRMGNAAFFSSLLVAGVIGLALSRRAARNTVILLTSLVVLDLVIVGSWFGVERLAKRLEETTFVDVGSREGPAAHALDMIKDYPVFGAGPGTFYVAFPRYRPESITAFFDHAHNDYAQIAAESGLLGLALLGLLVALTLAAALKAQWVRRDPLMRGMSFACIMGVTSILIHSWVDFNLQIPANAVLFMVLLSLGWISLHLGREAGHPPVREGDAEALIESQG